MSIFKRSIWTATRAIVGVLFALGSAGSASSAPQDYKVEGFARNTGHGTEIVVSVQNLRTGNFVANAKVWHFTAYQMGMGSVPYPVPLLEMRHDALPDGKDAYVVALPTQALRPFEHFMAVIPGEEEPIHARVQMTVRQ